MKMEYFKLSNGKSIPVIGIGPGGCYYKSMHVNENATYISKMIAKVHDHLVYQNVARKYSIEVSNALKSGFRLIDYSASYGTGVPIKNAIRLSGIDRKEFFITTRISNEAQFNKTIKKEFFSQLEGLGVDYVDLLQFHWPVSGFYIDTWKEMLDLYKKGYCKSIGVANCNIHHLEELFKVSDIIPEVNQFEVHPLFTQKELVSYCKSKGIMVEAYTAIARMDDRLMRLPKLKNIAKKYL
jgi:diketogulonate reductase-like aldo/keto reductase